MTAPGCEGPSKTALVFLWVFGVSCLLLTLPLLGQIPESVQEEGYGGLAVLLLVLLVGIGVLAWASALTAQWKRDSAYFKAAGNPGAPWTLRREWGEGRIPSSNRTAMLFWWAIALFWNLLSIPVCVLLIIPNAMEEIAQGEFPLFLVFLVNLPIGLYLIFKAAAETLRYKRFGVSVFEMDSVPGVIGGQLRGVIQAPLETPPREEFKLTLSCQRIYRYSDLGADTVWQAEHTVTEALEHRPPSTYIIPVLFEIPEECPETDPEATKSDSYVGWQLSAEVNQPGCRYRAEFEVPIFKVDVETPAAGPEDRK